MKITDLQLQQYGIYHDASWQPSQTSLNIVMGENESGKTTMLRFIRDMLFGYGRTAVGATIIDEAGANGRDGKEIWDSSAPTARLIGYTVTKKSSGLKTQTM